MMELSIFIVFMMIKIVSTAAAYSVIGTRIIRMFLGLIGLAYTKGRDIFLSLDIWTITYIVNLKTREILR